MARFYANRCGVVLRGQLAAGDDVLIGQLWLQQGMVNGFGELFERECSEVKRPFSIHFAPSSRCLAQIAAPINPALLPSCAGTTSTCSESTRNTLARIERRIGSSINSPAAATPPPMTMRRGVVAVITLAMPAPMMLPANS